MYNLSLFFFFSSRTFEPTFSLFCHFVYLHLNRNLVPRSSHSLRLSRHFEYVSILVGNLGHVILLCARVFSRAAAILKTEKTLGTRLGEDPGTQQITCLQRGWRCIQNGGYGEKGEKNWVRDAKVKLNKMAQKAEVQFKKK